MFSSILFLILVLLIIGFSQAPNGNNWISSQETAFGAALAVYAIVIGIIWLQNRLLKFSLRQHRALFLKVANLDLIAFLIFYQFIIAGHRIFQTTPSINALTSLLFYLFGLYVFHVSAYPYLSPATRGAHGTAKQYALTEICFLIPFAIPFLFFTFLIDLVSLFPGTGLGKILLSNEGSGADLLLTVSLMILFVGATLLFFPPLIQKIWRCKPIGNPELKARLEAICKRADFKHAGMMTWTVLNHTYTAGIIGILPNFRYVMFTRRLLNELSKESIEAILAHEIGHSFRRHLMIYPFILLGIVVAAALFTLVFSDAIDWYFTLQNMIHPTPLWTVLYTFAFFIPYALIAALYFRIVFGFFSRLFERQADLHVFYLQIPAKSMRLALDELGKLTGNTHHLPSWHHHSIHDRIRFLEQSEMDPSIIEKHHKRVRKDVALFFLILLLFAAIALSPLFPSVPPFSYAASLGKNLSEGIANAATSRLQIKVADAYIRTYRLPGNPERLRTVLIKNIRAWLEGQNPEMIEYRAAKELADAKEFPPAAILMAKAWDSADDESAARGFLSDFSLLTKEILREYQGPESQELEQSYSQAALKIGLKRESNDQRNSNP